MKKTILFGAIASMAMAMTSCSGGNEQSNFSYEADLLNLITDKQTGTSEMSQCKYAFNYDNINTTMQMKVNALYVGGSTISFMSPDDVKFTENYYAQGSVVKFAIPSMSALSSALTATDLMAEISTAYNYNPALNMIINTWRRYIISYTVDNHYTVQTFEPTTYWKGTTNTSYVIKGEHKEFASSEPVYVVTIDPDKKTASLLIYNARFAEEMKSVNAMKIEGLTVSAASGLYKVEGSNLVPQVLEGNAWTPNTHFTFDSFTLATTATNLTTASLSFTVAGGFQAAGNMSSAF